LGFAAIVLACWLALADRRRWMKAMGLVVLLAVIGQGLLGANRVLLNSTVYAAIHACTAELVFALMVALCVFTGRNWIGAAYSQPDNDHLRRRAVVTLSLIYSQMVVGAILRHFGAGLAVHAVLAVAVWGHAAMLAWRVERVKASVPALLPSARAMALAVSLQVLLGAAAWWMLRPFDGIPRAVSTAQALVRTGHLANGALLLGASVVLTLRAFRHLSPAQPARRPREALATSSASLEMVT
jgi:cytochrome c oxidase assembly protein subunit 15